MKTYLLMSISTLMFPWMAGCGEPEPPPWPQEQAEQAARTIFPAVRAASRAAVEAGPSLTVAFDCPGGGYIDVSGRFTGDVDGDIVTTIVDLDMTLVACDFGRGPMDGAIDHVENTRIDMNAPMVELTGSTNGKLDFAGELMGACWFDTAWTADAFTGAVDLRGKACGRNVSLVLSIIGGDEVWDQEEAADAADEAFRIGDNGVYAVAVQHPSDPGTLEVDLMADCFSGGSMQVTGTRTEIVDDASTMIEHALTLVLTECKTGRGPASGAITFHQRDYIVHESGESMTVIDLDGQVSFSDLRWPTRPCELALHREIVHSDGNFTTTGTACGLAVSISRP